MLELPECVVLARQLRQTVAGRRVERVVAAASPHKFAFFEGDPREYPRLLEGRVIEDARQWGGLVELRMEDMSLLLGDGVNVRYLAPGGKAPSKHQLLLTLEDGACLACTVQMYGGMWAYAEGQDLNWYHQVARERPSPLSEEFDRGYFQKLFHGTKKNLSVKAFLATEQRIPGLGNGVLQDILFRARLNPKTKLERLEKEQEEGLFTAVKETLAVMAEQGGRDVEKDLFGNPGGYRTILSRLTGAYPCPVCSGPIVRQSYLGGNVYFCPACQPLER